MKTIAVDGIDGFEHDWLATDAEGFVAFFSSAGAGYVPQQYLDHMDSHATAVVSILAQPASTTAEYSPELTAGADNVWRKMAERGIFAFDADPNGGPYKLVAKPSVATRAERLAIDPAILATMPQYDHVRFAEKERLDNDDLTPHGKGRDGR